MNPLLKDSSSRAEKAAEVARLHGTGMNARQIADTMGIGRSYAAELIHDPEGLRARQRKAALRGVCEVCGGPTSGSDGPPAKVCCRCLSWTPEQCIEAVDDYFGEHSRSPRCADADGNPGLPSQATAEKYFGSWNGLLLAAELPLNMDRRAETEEAMEQMLRDGMSIPSVAEQFGWTTENVRQRLRNRGLHVTDINPDYTVQHSTGAGPIGHPEHVRRRAVQLYAEGMSSLAVADAIGGISWPSVLRWARAAGVPVRPRGPRPVERKAA